MNMLLGMEFRSDKSRSALKDEHSSIELENWLMEWNAVLRKALRAALAPSLY